VNSLSFAHYEFVWPQALYFFGMKKIKPCVAHTPIFMVNKIKFDNIINFLVVNFVNYIYCNFGTNFKILAQNPSSRL
jgi:hypothetical protein